MQIYAELRLLIGLALKRLDRGRLWRHWETILAILLVLALTFLGGCSGTTPQPKPIPVPAPPPTPAPPPAPAPMVSMIYVDPMKGNDQNPGSESAPLKTIQAAINLAQPGNTIILAPGTYLQDAVSKRNGLPGSPITIKGPPTAVIKGGGNGRIIEINHDYITLDGFTVDGLFGDPDKASGYRGKLIYAIGKEIKSGVTGLRILNMTLKNSGGEAVRLRYFSQSNEVAYCTISNCGIYDFKFGFGSDNGEGIYIGTAPNQLGDGKNPTADPDQSNDNWIHHNFINTQGAECIDIKEGSSGNIVEYNSCTGQKVPTTAGLQSRGNNNIFRANKIYGNVGAGVRLGSDIPTEAIRNDVYGNDIRDNQGGGIKFMNAPQGKICSNIMSNNIGGNSVGAHGSQFSPTTRCGE